MFSTNNLLKKRIHALTTDLFIIVVTNYFFMASFTNFLKTVFFHFPFRAQMFLIHKLAAMSSVSLMSLTFAYFSIFYYVTDGRTMGKTIFGLKVVSPMGEMSLKQSMQRAFAYFTCAIFGSFLFALSFVRKDNKSLADIFSGTSVVFESEAQNISIHHGTEFQLTLVEEIDQIEENKAA